VATSHLDFLFQLQRWNPGAKLITKVLSLLLLVVNPSLCAAADNASTNANDNCDWTTPLSHKGVYRFALENDVFSQTDRYYTNGFKFQWVSPQFERALVDEKCPAPDWAQRAADAMYGLVGGQKISARNATWAWGQDMFTPTDRTRRTYDPSDRPYAGWMYLAVGINGRETIEKKALNDIEVLHSLEYNIGIVGRSALGKQFQDTIHDARGLDRFDGWSNQLHDEPGIKITHERKWRYGAIRDMLRRGKCDLVTHAGVTIGNVQTYINGGLEIRYGSALPDDFGTSPIRPGGNSDAPTAKKRTGYFDRGWHAFASLNARAVARDIFLDGSTWKDSPSIGKKRFVADVTYGAVVSFDKLSISYFKVARSREFIGQRGTQRFGGLLFSFEY
jgi:lipid A 3-O-deacylase